MPKEIILLRHAKSSWDEPGRSDLDRPLNPRGERDARRIGRFMAERGHSADLVLCSPAKRTRETVALLEEGLGRTLPVKIENAIYLAEPGVLLELLRKAPASAGRVMLVGHDPGMPGLALSLVRDKKGPLVDRLKEKFPTGALAVLHTEADDWRALRPASCSLEAFVVPREL